MKFKAIVISLAILFVFSAFLNAGDKATALRYIGALQATGAIDSLEVGKDHVWAWWNQLIKPLTYSEKVILGNTFAVAFPGYICVICDKSTEKRLIYVTSDGEVIARETD